MTTRAGTTLVVASALDDRNSALAHLSNLLWLGSALTFVGATSLAWTLAGAALRPVERLRAEAGSYSATDLTQRLAVPPSDDELHRLALTLNGMLDRIHESFERQRFFVDRASHELRTPLANLSMALELALRRERSQAELRAALASAADETRRLDRLASNLLVLARTTDGLLPILREDTDLAAVVKDTTATFAARAETDGVELTTHIGVTGSVAVDPIRIRQALTNLTENALRVTPRGGDDRGDRHRARVPAGARGLGVRPVRARSSRARLTRRRRARPRDRGGRGRGARWPSCDRVLQDGCNGDDRAAPWARGPLTGLQQVLRTRHR